jgi:hypothetical protein
LTIIDLSDFPDLACEAVRDAYPDCPSIGRLMLEAAAEHTIWRSAQQRPDHHAAAYLREHERAFWVLHGAALDICALQSGHDLHSAAQAARAGHEVARIDGGWSRDSEAAREQLRADYQELRDGLRHSWDCPGNCGGAGERLQVVTEEYQGDGVWVAVWQEPVDCDRGMGLEHLRDCECGGTGWVIERNDRGTPRERGRCSGRPAMTTPTWRAPAGPVADADPWGEPPF